MRNDGVLIYRNLDETTRSVYKENVRVSEALQYHVAEGDKLKRLKEQLQDDNDKLRADEEMNNMVIKEKVSESKTQKKQIKEVRFLLDPILVFVKKEMLWCVRMMTVSICPVVT